MGVEFPHQIHEVVGILIWFCYPFLFRLLPQLCHGDWCSDLTKTHRESEHKNNKNNVETKAKREMRKVWRGTFVYVVSLPHNLQNLTIALYIDHWVLVFRCSQCIDPKKFTKKNCVIYYLIKYHFFFYYFFFVNVRNENNYVLGILKSL